MTAISGLITGVTAIAAVLAATPIAPVLWPYGLVLAAIGIFVAGLYYWQMRQGLTHWRRGWLALTITMPVLLACSVLPAGPATNVVIPGDGVTLAATLYLPRTQGPHPGVVLIHGSTPQTRDSLFGLYRSVAAELADRGIATLVYDKRGCGASSGDYGTALFDELSADAVSALDWMARHEEIDSERLGLWGISQGGWVGTRAAERSEHARFLVLVSAPMSNEGDQRIFEWMSRLTRERVPEEHRSEAAHLQRLIWDYYGTGQGWEAASEAWTRARSSPWWDVVKGLERRGPAPPNEVRSPAGQASLRWQRTDRLFDPREVLRELSMPVLAIYGGRDEIIPIPTSYERAKAVLQQQGIRGSRAVIYDDAKHPLMEFAPLPRFPDGYLETMSGWILSETVPD